MIFKKVELLLFCGSGVETGKEMLSVAELGQELLSKQRPLSYSHVLAGVGDQGWAFYYLAAM